MLYWESRFVVVHQSYSRLYPTDNNIDRYHDSLGIIETLNVQSTLETGKR